MYHQREQRSHMHSCYSMHIFSCLHASLILCSIPVTMNKQINIIFHCTCYSSHRYSCEFFLKSCTHQPPLLWLSHSTIVYYLYVRRGNNHSNNSNYCEPMRKQKQFIYTVYILHNLSCVCAGSMEVNHLVLVSRVRIGLWLRLQFQVFRFMQLEGSRLRL